MAVTTYTRQVNGGATGWTKAQVMDALGLLFDDLGFHAPQNTGFLGSDSVTAPTGGWSQVGGDVGSLPSTTYYFYNVPASGGRSGGRFRITRGTDGIVDNVEPWLGSWGDTDDDIDPSCMGSGWSDEEVFTIPGTATGGSSPTHDIVFGVNDASTPSVTVYTSNDPSGPGGSEWFWGIADSYNVSQSADNPVRIMKVQNDANKTFGSTYWSFRCMNDNPDWIELGCGNIIDVTHNRWGGAWGVDQRGGDGGTYSSSYNASIAWGPSLSPAYSGTGSYTYSNRCGWFRYRRSNTPTDYPISVRAYTDGNGFAVVSFVQTVNGNEETYGTFWMYKGTGLYNGLVDLDYLTLNAWGPVAKDDNTSQRLVLGFGGVSMTNVGDTVAYPSDQANNNPARYASYGFQCNTDFNSSGDPFNGTASTDVWYFPVIKENYYGCSIREQLIGNVYFRDTAIQSGSVVDSATDFYRPLAGIPLASNLLPVPGYYPDDFALISFEVTPGAATFFQGDTITVSAGEVYTVIVASYLTDENSGAYSRGIAFCARTT